MHFAQQKKNNFRANKAAFHRIHSALPIRKNKSLFHAIGVNNNQYAQPMGA